MCRGSSCLRLLLWIELSSQSLFRVESLGSAESISSALYHKSGFIWHRVICDPLDYKLLTKYDLVSSLEYKGWMEGHLTAGYLIASSSFLGEKPIASGDSEKKEIERIRKI